MSDTYTIYHNPRCSKSRLALRILSKHTDEMEVVRYQQEGIDEAVVLQAIRTFGQKNAVRMAEPEFKKLVPYGKKLSDEALAKLVVENPEIMQRPLVVAPNGKMVIGRPPEEVEKLFK